MLIACHSCHRQYDVGGLETGAKVRCFCGTLNKVPAPRARQVPMQHCSNCGGALEAHAKRCGYCQNDIQIHDRGWGDACPECYARMVKGAKFCGACGTEIHVQAALQVMNDQDCPRCKGPLSLCQGERESFTECTQCGGIWLSSEAFEELTAQSQRRAVGDFVAAKPKELPALPREAKVQYLACPVCHELMNRRNFATHSGIIIDWCREHGYWFDLHELEHIQRFVEEGGLERARERRFAMERDRARKEAPMPMPIDTLSIGPRHRRSLLDSVVDTVMDILFW